MYQNIEFRKNSDVIEHFDLWIRVQRAKIHKRQLLWFFTHDIFVFCRPV